MDCKWETWYRVPLYNYHEYTCKNVFYTPSRLFCKSFDTFQIDETSFRSYCLCILYLCNNCFQAIINGPWECSSVEFQNLQWTSPLVYTSVIWHVSVRQSGSFVSLRDLTRITKLCNDHNLPYFTTETYQSSFSLIYKTKNCYALSIVSKRAALTMALWLQIPLQNAVFARNQSMRFPDMNSNLRMES